MSLTTSTTQTERFRTDSGEYAVHIRETTPSRPFAIYLHGAGFNCHGERQVLGPCLESRQNMIWFDLLGGADSPARSPNAISWGNQIADIAAIARTFASGPVDVIGHCMGTHITHDLVRAHRDLVRRVAWLSPARSITGTLKGILARSLVEGRLQAANLSEDEKNGLIRFIATPSDALTSDDALTVLSLSAKVNGLQELYWTDESAMHRYVGFMGEKPFSVDAFLRLQGDFFSERRDSLSTPDYAGIPVLILHSTDDRITPRELNGARLEKDIPHAVSKFVEGASHWMHFQKPQVCADEICSFFSLH